MTAPPVTLAAYSDAELAAFYNASPDEQWQSLLEAEMERRDTAGQARQARRTDPVATEWTMAAHAQYLDAERECAGNLVRSDSPVTDAWQLWSGPERYALAHATGELRGYWLRNPRMTVTAYQRQAAAGRTAEREARHEAVVTDDTGQVRPQTAGSAGSDAPVDAVGAGSEQDRGPDGDAGHARATRPGGNMTEHVVRGYGTTPRPAGSEADHARLQARAGEIRAAAEAERNGGSLPAAYAAGDTSDAVRPSQCAVALRRAGHVTRAEERAAEIISEALRYAERVLTRHVSWPTPQALDTVLLWLLHANARDRDDTGTGPLIWRASPRLMLTSKVRGSGKSTGLDLIAILAGSRAGRLSRVTAPGFAKLMAKYQETAVLDEAKMIFGSGQKSLDLQGMLLTGYTRRANSLTAHNGGQLESVFGAVAYAGKDNLITTASDSIQDLLDRSVIIRMRRPSRHYPDIDDVAERACELAQQGMATWATTMRVGLLSAVARLNREAADAGELDAKDVDNGILRAMQLWRPLIACADVLGGEWPERARDAAAAGDAETEEWLTDLRDLDAALWADPEEGPRAAMLADLFEDAQ